MRRNKNFNNMFWKYVNIEREKLETAKAEVKKQKCSQDVISNLRESQELYFSLFD